MESKSICFYKAYEPIMQNTELTPYSKLILIYLISLDIQGLDIYTSNQGIASKIGSDISTVIRAFKDCLIPLNLVERVQNSTGKTLITKINREKINSFFGAEIYSSIPSEECKCEESKHTNNKSREPKHSGPLLPTAYYNYGN